MAERVREFRDEGVVVRTYRSGEADRVSVVWTREHGKIRVLARGARKASSKIGGALDVLSHVDLAVVSSRGGFYIATNVRHRNHFEEIRHDLDRLQAGYVILEAVDQLPGVDEVVDDAFFDLLVRVLEALAREEFSPALIPSSFFLRLLAHDGSAPVLDQCVECGRTDGLVAFNIEVGGVLCAGCRSGTSLSGDALVLLRRIVEGDLAGVLREASPAGAREVAALTLASVESHFGRRLRTTRDTGSAPPPSN